MLREESKAPDFKLVGDDGKTHTLADFRDTTLVLYFYPKDDTPGCTIEARDFSKLLPQIKKAGADVVGVSKDGFDSHCKFRDKYKLKVLLLSDPTGKTIKSYGAYGDRGIFGKGTLRKTFVIRKGKIVKDFGKVSAIGHAAAVLEYLKK
ncbi:MAG: peroxiredoxin [Candidatus Micrarchaeales archaeon]|nr:peroxiredoxin [Candidatus Micrarchaeales archaeon]